MEFTHGRRSALKSVGFHSRVMELTHEQRSAFTSDGFHSKGDGAHPRATECAHE